MTKYEIKKKITEGYDILDRYIKENRVEVSAPFVVLKLINNKHDCYLSGYEFKSYSHDEGNYNCLKSYVDNLIDCAFECYDDAKYFDICVGFMDNYGNLTCSDDKWILEWYNLKLNKN